MVKHYFELRLELTTISPNRKIAQQIMLDHIKSKKDDETQGITGMLIYNGT